MKERFPLHEGSVALGVAVGVMLPFVMVGYVLGAGAIKGVQWVQRVCCGVLLDEEREGSAVDGVSVDGAGGVELEEGRRSGESVYLCVGEGEERAALMGNANGSRNGKGQA